LAIGEDDNGRVYSEWYHIDFKGMDLYPNVNYFFFTRHVFIAAAG
jgi:hypothetical protein